MATTNRGFAVPEGGDDVDIPGDVVNLTNTIIPGKTTAQLAAMSWADKPAGWLAYDTTLGRVVISTGAAMVPVVDGRGASLSGDLIFDNDSVDGHKIMFRTSGIDGWRILALTGGSFVVQRRDPSTGDYLDNPLLIEASGNVASRSHIGGSASGSTNLAGSLTKTVIAPPTGKSWSVTCNATRADTGAPLAVIGIPTTSTAITFTCYWGTSAYQGAVQILYHLIAY